MIILDNKKITANELAKEIVLDLGASGSNYWGERLSYKDTVNKMTDREIALVDEAILKQKNRVARFLNLDIEFSF